MQNKIRALILAVLFASPSWAAMEFFGNAIDDTIGFTPSGVANSNEGTFTAWVFPQDTSSTYTGIISMNASNPQSGRPGMILADSLNDDLVYIWNGDEFAFDSGLTPILNQWQFFAVVITPTEARYYQYHESFPDGRRTATRSDTHLSQSFNQIFYIGEDARSAVNTRHLDGYLDDVRFYRRALSEAEIDTLGRCRCKYPITDGLVVWFKMDEKVEGATGGASSVLDSSGNGFHASPTGTANPAYTPSTWLNYP